MLELAVVLGLLALGFALAALVIVRQAGPPAWASRLTAAEVEIADLHEALDSHQRSLAKWRSRVASRDRRASKPNDDTEPDPYSDPEAWKAWINAGRASKAVLDGR